MQKNENKNQHYVPQFYLKNFSENNKSIGMFLFDKNRYVSEASIAKIVAEEFFYGKDLDIEKYLGRLEGTWAEEFKILINQSDSDKYTDSDKFVFDLLHFITIQITRTKKTYDSQVAFKNFMEAFITHERDLGHKIGFNLDDYIPKNFNPLLAPLKTAEDLVPILSDLAIMILINDTNDLFITSDNPVVIYNLMCANRNFRGNYGLASFGLVILLPLSPRMCLCLFDSDAYYPINNNYEYHINMETEVFEVNKILTRNAYNAIFLGRSQDFAYAKKLEPYLY